MNRGTLQKTNRDSLQGTNRDTLQGTNRGTLQKMNRDTRDTRDILQGTKRGTLQGTNRDTLYGIRSVEQRYSIGGPNRDTRPTQSMIYVPLLVNEFQKIVLLIVQYTYLKS